MMFRPLDNPKNEGLPDLNWREKWTLIPLIVLAFWIGLYPKPFLAMMDAPITRLVHQQINPVLRQTGAPVVLPDVSSVCGRATSPILWRSGDPGRPRLRPGDRRS